jgi:hypothetical protein
LSVDFSCRDADPMYLCAPLCDLTRLPGLPITRRLPCSPGSEPSLALSGKNSKFGIFRSSAACIYVSLLLACWVLRRMFCCVFAARSLRRQMSSGSIWAPRTHVSPSWKERCAFLPVHSEIYHVLLLRRQL